MSWSCPVGTKVKANASKHKAMSYARMSEREAALKQQVTELLARAQAVDDAEDAEHGRDRRGDELPEDLQRVTGRLAKIQAARAALEAEAREQAVSDAEVAKARQAERERKEQENGRRFAGRPFKVPDPEQAKPSPKAQRNVTDPESRIQKTPDGFIQGYTAVLAVDDEALVIVSQHVTPSSPEVHELRPAVEAIEQALGQRPKQVVADAGYWSQENIERLEAQSIDGYIARGRAKHNEPPPPSPRGRIPATLTSVERMQRKLRTKAGRAVYTRLPPDAAHAVARTLERPDVAGGGFRLAFDAVHPALRLLERLSALPWTCAYFGDQGFFCRRVDFLAVGGYPEQPLFEDVGLARRLAGRGRLVRLPGRARTSARRFLADGPWRRLAGNAAMLALHRLGVSAATLARHYRP